MSLLEAFSDNDLRLELERREMERRRSPTAYWKVTTEGDVEGRSTRLLMDAEFGHFAEIALKYAGFQYYSLSLDLVKPELIKPKTAPRDKVSVSVPYEVADSHYTNNQQALVRLMQAFVGPEYIVTPGTYFRTVEISRKK